jgi:hypothetical protein
MERSALKADFCYPFFIHFLILFFHSFAIASHLSQTRLLLPYCLHCRFYLQVSVLPTPNRLSVCAAARTRKPHKFFKNITEKMNLVVIVHQKMKKQKIKQKIKEKRMYLIFY